MLGFVYAFQSAGFSTSPLTPSCLPAETSLPWLWTKPLRELMRQQLDQLQRPYVHISVPGQACWHSARHFQASLIAWSLPPLHPQRSIHREKKGLESPHTRVGWLCIQKDSYNSPSHRSKLVPTSLAVRRKDKGWGGPSSHSPALHISCDPRCFPFPRLLCLPASPKASRGCQALWRNLPLLGRFFGLAC